MKKELLDDIKSLINISEESQLNSVVEVFVEQAPIIGKLLSSYKVHRLGRRLEQHKNQIKEIRLKVEKIDNVAFSNFLKSFLFPKILEDLMEEDEDKKIGYFLNGFEQVIDNKFLEESKILIYYDVIRELRYLEMEYLITHSNEYIRYKNEFYSKNRKPLTNPFDTEDFKEVKYAVESKLERIGLIDTGRLISYEQVMKRMNDALERAKRHLPSSRIKEANELTVFGYKFLNFFYLLDRYKQYYN